MTPIRCLFALLAFALLWSPGALAGSSVRYALVVGNNDGRSRDVALEPLRHAENDARGLRDSLLLHANFDEERVVLVTGGGRREILAAAAKLAERHRLDRAELGSLPTLFALFFTGHGLAGKLLTADEPLSGQDIATIKREMDASLTLGFFDACFSGGLDLDALKGKGAVATPGFNPVAELPKEVLDSEGTMWFVSSQQGEASFEDEKLGGLFTHFFGEAFTSAPTDGVGVSLEGMWEYARAKTVAHAARHGKRQTPAKLVRNLDARGPVYFAFPRRRTATLRFDDSTSGTFLVRYDESALVERVRKRAGVPLDVAAYEGEVTISRVDGALGESAPMRQLHLERGAVVRLRDPGRPLPSHAPGFAEVPMRSKGELADLALTEKRSRAVFLLGGGYRFSNTGANALAAPHGAGAGFGLAFGAFSLGLELGFSTTSESFPAWSFRASELGTRLVAGYGFDLGGPRLDVEALAGAALTSIEYGTGNSDRSLGQWAGAGLRLLLPTRSPAILSLRAGPGLRLSRGIAQSDTARHATFAPYFQADLLFPVSFD